MNDQQILSEVVELFYLHGGKTIDPTGAAVWVKNIKQFRSEVKATPQQLGTAITTYKRTKCQFPDFGELCELIRPTAATKATKDKEERMIDEYATGNRSWDKLPQEMKDALNAIGGVFDYRNAKDGYQRAEWLKRYHAARETNEAGYVPEKHTALPPPPPAQPGEESPEAVARVKARFEEFSKKQAAALEKLTANAAKLEK